MPAFLGGLCLDNTLPTSRFKLFGCRSDFKLQELTLF